MSTRSEEMNARNLRRMGLALALLAVLVLASACATSEGAPAEGDGDPGGGKDVVLSADDNGSQVELAPGQVLEVTLASNPTTGYSWEVSEVDEAVLTQVGDVEFREAPKEDEQTVGVGGTETFRFSSAAGDTTLALVYHRPWEKDVEPLETFTVQVAVR
jgi:inhibitor of cysteine peptidase